jgi:hypothetical protein
MANGDEGVGAVCDGNVRRVMRPASRPAARPKIFKSCEDSYTKTLVWYWHNIYHPNPEKEFCNRKNNYD